MRLCPAFRGQKKKKKKKKKKKEKKKITIKFLKGLQEDLQVVLGSIKELHFDLPGEQQVKNAH